MASILDSLLTSGYTEEGLPYEGDVVVPKGINDPQMYIEMMKNLTGVGGKGLGDIVEFGLGDEASLKQAGATTLPMGGAVNPLQLLIGLGATASQLPGVKDMSSEATEEVLSNPVMKLLFPQLSSMSRGEDIHVPGGQEPTGEEQWGEEGRTAKPWDEIPFPGSDVKPKDVFGEDDIPGEAHPEGWYPGATKASQFLKALEGAKGAPGGPDDPEKWWNKIKKSFKGTNAFKLWSKANPREPLTSRVVKLAIWNEMLNTGQIPNALEFLGTNIGLDWINTVANWSESGSIVGRLSRDIAFFDWSERKPTKLKGPQGQEFTLDKHGAYDVDMEESEDSLRFDFIK